MLYASAVAILLWGTLILNVCDTSEGSFPQPYPANITDLTFNTTKYGKQTIPFQPGTTLEIICFWTDGYPPVKARLLDKNGLEFENRTESTGQIRHTLFNVGCQDAGPIRCQAPGASRNLTTSLLVRCPPELAVVQDEVTAINNGSAKLLVNVTSHTEKIEDCRIIKLVEAKSISEGMISSHFQLPSCTVAGPPPSLVLTVELDYLTTEDEGLWRLELANDVGKGYADFHVHVKDNTTEITTTPGAKSPPKSDTNMYVVGIVVLVGAIIVLILVVGLLKKETIRRFLGREAPQGRNKVSTLPKPRQVFYREAERGTRVSGLENDYMDVEVQSEAQVPGADSGEYLQPVQPVKASGKKGLGPESGQENGQASSAYQPLQIRYLRRWRGKSGRKSAQTM